MAQAEVTRDQQIQQAVRQALAENPLTRALRLAVSVLGGIVRLEGIVPTEQDRLQAEQVARTVEGVVDVHNHLNSDEAIVCWVQSALASDPRTAGAAIEVGSIVGTVTLRGVVHDPAVREAAAEIARRHPQVRLVINEIEVRPEEKTEAIPVPPVVVLRQQ